MFVCDAQLPLSEDNNIEGLLLIDFYLRCIVKEVSRTVSGGIYQGGFRKPEDVKIKWIATSEHLQLRSFKLRSKR